MAMRIYVFPNLKKKNCAEYTAAACKVLNNCGAELYIDEIYKDEFCELKFLNFIKETVCISTCDVIVVVGGDGTILKCAKFAAAHKKPILGINSGRLGFMTSLEHNQIELLEKLCKGEYSTSRRMMLSVSVEPKGSEKLKFTALNDVVISKSDDCKIADFEVSKNGKTISSLRADGVIFSTPTGATAYSMSAGGPIIEPELECIEYTQICPHTLFARSVVLSPDSIIKIKSKCNKQAHTCVNVDGNIVHRLSNDDEVIVSKSEYYIDIIEIAGGSFFASVNKKLMQPLKEISE